MAGSGVFGKIPSHGDFVQRSLPPDFVKPWDDWLQAGLASSKDVLGADWLDIYLTSPVWRFALASGLAGNVGAAGLFIPSVDRVGRYFPFTLATLAGDASPLELRSNAGDWFAAAEALALSVLEEDFSFDDLMAALEDLTLPPPPSAEPVTPDPWRFAENGGEDSGAALQNHLAAKLASGYGLFWTSGSAVVAPSTLLVRQMPSARQFTALLDGAWADHGWREEAS
ncbi:MAG: type VI secretion system-associated protein TagF [Geminicoccaceae bacterium]